MLHKIFRIQESDSLIWQIDYTDSDVNNIIANRYHQFHTKPAKKQKKKINKGCSLNPTVERIPIDDTTVWYLGYIYNSCICHDYMKKEDLLTFCIVSCGNNMHIECALKWIKHKISQSQKLTCPLCRAEWNVEFHTYLETQAKENRKKVLLQEQMKMREEMKKKEIEENEDDFKDNEGNILKAMENNEEKKGSED